MNALFFLFSTTSKGSLILFFKIKSKLKLFIRVCDLISGSPQRVTGNHCDNNREHLLTHREIDVSCDVMDAKVCVCLRF